MILDTVIVRTLLVPALLGDWNWWMPARLAPVLRVTTAVPAASQRSQ